MYNENILPEGRFASDIGTPIKIVIRILQQKEGTQMVLNVDNKV